MSDHTKGPLEAVGRDIRTATPGQTVPYIVAVTGVYIFSPGDIDGGAEANAARLAAAWNAVEGIPTNSLTLGVVARLVAACREHARLCKHCNGTGTRSRREYDAASGEMEWAGAEDCPVCAGLRSALALIPPEAA